MKIKKAVGMAALSAVLVGMLLLLNACMKMRTNDDKTLAFFKEKGLEAKIRKATFRGKETRVIETSKGDSLQNLVIFVHGAPGSADAFHKFLADSALLQKAVLVSVDRLGYGYSDYGNSVGIQAQADFINSVAERYPAKKTILVGHSFGGPIVAKCAMDKPGAYHSIVMLAPANDPENEKIFWFSHFGRWKLTKWMLNDALQVAGDEKFAHSAELEKIREGWAKLQTPILHLHGNKDTIVPYAPNAAFSKKHIPASLLSFVEIPDENHFIPWTKHHFILKHILSEIERP